MIEIQKADPRARRRAILTVVFAALIGSVSIFLLEQHGPALQDWIARDPAQLAKRLEIGLIVLTAAISLPLLAFAAYLWRFANRVIRTERMPPPGFAVVRDTPVLRGQFARHRGRMAQALAGFLALLACVLPIIFWWLLATLNLGTT